MRKAPRHRFVARNASLGPIGKVALLLPALLAAAFVAHSAQAVELGLRAGGGASVQAAPVNVGVSAATDARVDTAPVHQAMRGARDAGARAVGRVGSEVSGAARAGATATGSAQAGIAAQDDRVSAAADHSVQTRTDARIDAHGSVHAAHSATDSSQTDTSKSGTSPSPPRHGKR